jgi:hypothetical protein
MKEKEREKKEREREEKQLKIGNNFSYSKKKRRIYNSYMLPSMNKTIACFFVRQVYFD